MMKPKMPKISQNTRHIINIVNNFSCFDKAITPAEPICPMHQPAVAQQLPTIEPAAQWQDALENAYGVSGDTKKIKL